MLKYKVREWTVVEYDMSLEHFKNYIVEVRGFYSSYVGGRVPDFYMLMRNSESAGFVTECATIPYEMIGDVEDLSKWFDENYQKVYDHLKENSQELY